MPGLSVEAPAATGVALLEREELLGEVEEEF